MILSGVKFVTGTLELAKPRLYNKEDPEARATAQHVLAEVLTSAMKLLHPYMPFITEEIYQCLPHESNSIMMHRGLLLMRDCLMIKQKLV